MNEFYEAGTEYDPRVKFVAETQTLHIHGRSNCEEPAEFYDRYRTALIEHIADRSSELPTIRAGFEFLSSGSQTEFVHLLTEVDKAVREHGRSGKLVFVWEAFDDPTVEDGLRHIERIIGNLNNIDLKLEEAED